MSRAAAVRAAVRQAFNNPALMLDDVREVQPDAEVPEGQVSVYLVDPGVTVMVPIKFDRRGQPVQTREELGGEKAVRDPAPPKPKIIPRLPPRPTKRRV